MIPKFKCFAENQLAFRYNVKLVPYTQAVCQMWTSMLATTCGLGVPNTLGLGEKMARESLLLSWSIRSQK